MARLLAIALAAALVLGAAVPAYATPAQPDGHWYGAGEADEWVKLDEYSGYDPRSASFGKSEKQQYQTTSGRRSTAGIGSFVMDGDYFGSVPANSGTGAQWNSGFVGRIIEFTPPETLPASASSSAYYGSYSFGAQASPNMGMPQYLVHDARYNFTVPAAYGMAGYSVMAGRGAVPGGLGSYYINPQMTLPNDAVWSVEATGAVKYSPSSRAHVGLDFQYTFLRSSETTWSVRRVVRVWSSGGYKRSQPSYEVEQRASINSTMVPYPVSEYLPSVGSNSGGSANISLYPGSVVGVGENALQNGGLWPSGFDYTRQAGMQIEAVQASEISTGTWLLHGSEFGSDTPTPLDPVTADYERSLQSSDTSMSLPAGAKVPGWISEWVEGLNTQVTGFVAKFDGWFWVLNPWEKFTGGGQ